MLVIYRAGNAGLESSTLSLLTWFGSLGAEVTGAVDRETHSIQSVTWTSKCLIPACKRQTGSWWRRYRGIRCYCSIWASPVLPYSPE